MQCNSEYRLIAVSQEFAFLMRLGSNLDCCCLSVNLPGGLVLLLRALSVLLAPAACWYPRGITHLYTMAPISVRSFVFFQCRSACKGCDCGQVWISPLGILKCLFVNRRSGRRLRGGATQTGGEVEVRPFCVLALLSIAPPKIKSASCLRFQYRPNCTKQFCVASSGIQYEGQKTLQAKRASISLDA